MLPRGESRPSKKFRIGGAPGGKKENFSIYKQNSDEKIGVFRAAQRAKKIDFMAKMQYNIIMYQNGYVCIFLNIL